MTRFGYTEQNEIQHKQYPVRKTSFVKDSGYRIVPTYQDKDGTSVFYAGSITNIKKQDAKK